MPIKIDAIENMLCPGSECNSGRGSLSAPASRSNSWKNRHRGSLRREKRPSNLTRTNSASTPDCSDTQTFMRQSAIRKECPLCTVRSFKTTSKGIVDSGSFNKSLSSVSLFSSGSLAVTGGGSCSNITNRSRSPSEDRFQNGGELTDHLRSINFSSALTASYYRTLVLGAPGVGKSSLVRHLTRSTSTSSCSEEESRHVANEPLVTVELDGQESTMEFIDGPEVSDLDHYRADAFIIMYAVSEPQSFTAAVALLNHLRQDLGTDRPIFVVANKTDLVRQRLVSKQDASSTLSTLDCHFLECSIALNVNLDQLLVLTLCRIKQKLTPLECHDLNSLAIACLVRKRRSSPGALTAISNFLKHACKRDNRGRNSSPVLQVV